MNTNIHEFNKNHPVGSRVLLKAEKQYNEAFNGGPHLSRTTSRAMKIKRKNVVFVAWESSAVPLSKILWAEKLADLPGIPKKLTLLGEG